MRPQNKNTFTLNNSSKWNSVAMDIVGEVSDWLIFPGVKTDLAARTEMQMMP